LSELLALQGMLELEIHLTLSQQQALQQALLLASLLPLQLASL